MLRINELARTVRLNFAVEQRPDGHHDHDASRSTGPCFLAPLTYASPAIEKNDSNIGFAECIEPGSGEIIFCPISGELSET